MQPNDGWSGNVCSSHNSPFGQPHDSYSNTHPDDVEPNHDKSNNW